MKRAFYSMKIVKNLLHNGVSDQLINDCLVTNMKNYVFDSIYNKMIIQII